jgi:hypothetical protein
LQHVPEIERRIQELEPDALVMGMGPTAWLLPWIDRRLLVNVRIWGCHDAARIYPIDDLVLMDPPIRGLHPDTSRYRHVVDARPKRLWVHRPAWGDTRDPNPSQWASHIHSKVWGVCRAIEFAVWDPEAPPDLIKPKLGRRHKQTGEPHPDTVAVSPTGATCLAWDQGARRIGVIGADMMRDHHHTYKMRHVVDQFFCEIGRIAHEKGGRIANLSPVTSLTRFEQSCQPANQSCTSGSGQTGTSEQPAPS